MDIKKLIQSTIVKYGNYEIERKINTDGILSSEKDILKKISIIEDRIFIEGQKTMDISINLNDLEANLEEIYINLNKEYIRIASPGVSISLTREA